MTKEYVSLPFLLFSTVDLALKVKLSTGNRIVEGRPMLSINNKLAACEIIFLDADQDILNFSSVTGIPKSNSIDWNAQSSFLFSLLL